MARRLDLELANEILADLAEQAEKKAQKKTGFADAGQQINTDEFHCILNLLYENREEKCLRTSLNYGYGTSIGSTCEGEWRFTQDDEGCLLFYIDGNLTLEVNTHQFDTKWVKVDSMGWIDVILYDTDVVLKNGPCELNPCVHFVFIPVKGE